MSGGVGSYILSWALDRTKWSVTCMDGIALGKGGSSIPNRRLVGPQDRYEHFTGERSLLPCWELDHDALIVQPIAITDYTALAPQLHSGR